MVLDSVNSFIDNLKTKVSNPFFGTLIAIWIIRNWNLVYGLFIFDKDCTMNDKFEFVRNHFNNKNIYNELWINISTTFVLILLGYILLIISRFLANLVEHRITPNVNRVAASKLVANKDVLTEIENQLLKKTNDLINERKLVNELELQLVDVRGRIEVATNEKNSAISKLAEQTKQNRESKSTIEFLERNNEIISQNLKESRTLGSEIRKIAKKCDTLNSENNISFNHIDCYLTLWNNNLVQEFAKMVSEFDSGSKKIKEIDTNKNLLKILDENKMTSSSFNMEEKSTTIKYTELGEEFAKTFYNLKKEFTSSSLFW